MNLPSAKPVVWIGSTREDLRALPADVQDRMGHALWVAQTGGRPLNAKALAGFGGASVLEIVDDFRGSTFRAVYTVEFPHAIFVRHVFQKKSRRGSRTLQRDIGLVRSRLEWARAIAPLTKTEMIP